MRLDAAGRRLPPPSRGQHPDGHWWLSMAAAAKVMDRPRASCHLTICSGLVTTSCCNSGRWLLEPNESSTCMTPWRPLTTARWFFLQFKLKCLKFSRS